jgi:nitroreductase
MTPDRRIIKWPEDSIYRRRQVELAKQLYRLMDIDRKDKKKRMEWMEQGIRFFDAPAAIIIATDKALNEATPLIDIGAALQNLCLAALKFGLGTCIEGQGIIYPDVIRKYAGIPDQKRIIIAVALGYPDSDFPANQVQSEREPLEKVVFWAGDAF